MAHRRLVIPSSLAAINPQAVALGAVRVEGRRGAGGVTPPKFNVRRVSAVELVACAPGLRLVSEANARERVGERIRRVSAERDAMASALRGVEPVRPPVVVWVVRCASRKMDRDNLPVAAKHIADAVARWAGVDDGDPDLFYCHADQEPAGAPSVRVYIHTHDEADGGGHSPWYVSRNAADRWAEIAGSDRTAATGELLRLGREAVERTDVRSVMGHRVYQHAAHQHAVFLVSHDLRPPATKILVTAVDMQRAKHAVLRSRR